MRPPVCLIALTKAERTIQQAAQGPRAANGIGSAFDTKGYAHHGYTGKSLRDLHKLGVDTTNL